MKSKQQIRLGLMDDARFAKRRGGGAVISHYALWFMLATNLIRSVNLYPTPSKRKEDKVYLDKRFPKLKSRRMRAERKVNFFPWEPGKSENSPCRRQGATEIAVAKKKLFVSILKWQIYRPVRFGSLSVEHAERLAAS